MLLGLAASVALVAVGDSVASGSATGGVAVSLPGQVPLACGIAPLSVLSASPGAERAGTPAAAALRAILATGIAGMSFPPHHDWVVVKATGDEVTFGHRVGTVGIGDVVTVRRENGRFRFWNSGGCGPLGYADGRTATHFEGFRARGRSLDVLWVGDSCVPGRPEVRSVESAGSVSVLVVPPPARYSGFCGGVGISETSTVELSAPLGGRRVLNAGYLPEEVVDQEK